MGLHTFKDGSLVLGNRLRRVGFALVAVGLVLGLSGCDSLGIFSVFGDFEDEDGGVVLIEEGNISRQIGLNAPTTATNAISEAAPAPLLSDTAAPTPLTGWQPGVDLNQDIRTYLVQLGPKAMAATAPMPGGAQAWAFVHGRGTADEVQEGALAICRRAARCQSITQGCELLYIDNKRQTLSWL